jgi:hypothetical protein
MMKRAKSRGGRKTSSVSTGRASRKPVDLSAIREDIKNLVGNAAAGMVASGIEEANKGHYAAMKFLFELVGLFPAAEAVEQNPEEDGLAKALFHRLGVADPAPEVTNDCAAALAAGSDAVK